MAITYSATVCKVLCDAAVDQCDVGGIGYVEIQSAASAVLVTLPFAATAFGAATAAAPSIATAAAIAPAAASGGGAGTAATKFTVNNNAATLLWTGEAGAAGSGKEMILDNVNIATGQVVTISSFTHTQPA
jgi:hypothetical protein